MKKITLLIAVILIKFNFGFSQCIRTTQYPTSVVVSNNLGLAQTIATCNYTSEFASLSGLLIGSNYIFTCNISGVENYITVTDLTNNVIAMGSSPLTVNAITSSEVLVNFSDDAACVSSTGCHATTIQILLTCPVPTGILVSNITNTNANYTWQPGGSETSWEVLVLPSSVAAPVASTSGIPISGTPSYSSNDLSPSNTYKFYVRANCGSEFSPWSGTTFSTPLANDNFANSISVSCGTTYSSSTATATLDEDSAPDGYGADLDAPNVWYSYTGSGSVQSVTLNLCNSSYDSSVLVYTGTSGNLTLVAGNDDDSTCGTLLSTRSRVTFTSDGVSTYYIAVEGYNVSSVGAFNMEVTCTSVTPPAVLNQNCTSALAVSVNGTDVVSDNSFGDSSSVQPLCDLFGVIQDVWFSFVAPSVSVDCLVTNGTMTSSNFNIYSGDCATLTAVTSACNSNLTTPTTESLVGLTVGNTYYVQVWSNASEQGTFTLKLSDATLSTNNFNSAAFSYYPNPVKNTLNLSYSENISDVSVYNLLGQQVIAKAVNANQSQIDMSHLTSGTYMVKVTSNSQVKTIKVIKE